MYKTIVPQLLSFDTDLKNIKGMMVSENFSFYPPTDQPLSFHYKISIDNSIKDLKQIQFRHGYFSYDNEVWIYSRKILGIFELKFKYNVAKKTFSFNRLYSLVPFEIGGIVPVGKLISDLIFLDLFLMDYLAFWGCAFQYEDKNLCLVAPSYNGKTSYLNSVLQKGGKYISDDILIINLKEKEVYPTTFRKNNFLRRSNILLSKNIAEENIINHKVKIDKLVFIQNTVSIADKKYQGKDKTLTDFLLLCSLSFLNSTFGRSYIFENRIFDVVLDKISILRKQKINFKSISTYKYDDIYK